MGGAEDYAGRAPVTADVQRDQLVAALAGLPLDQWGSHREAARLRAVHGDSADRLLPLIANVEKRAAVAEEAVKRVEALAKDLHTDARSMWTSAETHDSETDEVVGDTYYEVSQRIRAALASPAPAPQEPEGTDRG